MGSQRAGGDTLLAQKDTCGGLQEVEGVLLAGQLPLAERPVDKALGPA